MAKSKKKAAPKKVARKVVKKAAKPRKAKPAAKKAVVTKKAATPKPAPRAALTNPKAAELDARIAVARDNLRTLVEQAASVTGASAEELLSERIANQEAKLEALKKERDAL